MATGWVDPNPNGFITTPIDLGALFEGRPKPVDNGLLDPVPPNDPSRLPGQRTWMPPYAIAIEVVTTILLAIRLVSRISKLGGRPGLDDVFISIGWLSGIGITACCIYGSIHLGWGLHMLHTDPMLFSKSALLTMITQLLFVWSTMFTKLSILLFYRRLIKGTYSKRFKWALWFGMFLAVASAVVPGILLLLQCDPIEAIWMQYNITYVLQNAYKFHCDPIAKTIKIGLMTGVLSVITDFYSVLLPALLLMRIRLSKRQRLGLMAIFSVGFLVVAAGAVRTYLLNLAEQPIADRGWALYPVYAASIAECNVGIICACAPSLKTVFGRFFRDITSRGASKKDSKNSSADDSDEAVKRHTIFSYDTEYSELDTKLSSVNGGSLKQQVSAMKLKPAIDQDLSSFMETHEYGQDTFSPVVEGYAEEPITRFDTRSTPEPPDTEAKPRPAVVKPEISVTPFDLGGLLSSPPTCSNAQNTSPTVPPQIKVRSDKRQNAEGLRVPTGDERSRTPSFIFIDNENGVEQIKRVRYRSYAESSDSSTDDLTLSFPHMNPVISRAQSLRDAAELSRRQAFQRALGVQPSIQQPSNTIPSQPIAGTEICIPTPQRPRTAGAVSVGPLAFGSGLGSISNATRNANAQSQRNIAAVALPSAMAESSERPHFRHRNSISHISDPSEAGSLNGDAESETDFDGTQQPTTTTSSYQIARVQSLRSFTKIHNPSSLNTPVGRPSTASSYLGAANYAMRNASAAHHSHSHSLYSLPSSGPFAFQSLVSGLMSEPPNIDLNNPSTPPPPVEEPAGTSVAVPSAHNQGAGLGLSSAANEIPAGIARPRVRKVLSREKWRSGHDNY